MKKRTYFFSTLKIIYLNSPIRFIVCIGLLIFVSTFPLINLVTTNILIKGLTAIPFCMENIIFPIILYIISLLLNNTKTFINMLGSYIWITAEIALQKAMIKKAGNKSLIYYDTPSFYKNLQKAKEGYQSAVGTAMMLVSAIFISLLSIIFMAGYLCRIDARVAIVLILIVVIKSISFKFEARNLQELRDKQAEDIKKKDLLSTYFWTKESRSYGTTKYFWEQWKSLNEELSKEKMRLEQKNILVIFGLDFVSYFCYAFVLISSVCKWLQNENMIQSVSSVVILFVAMDSIFTNINTVVLQFGNLFKNAYLSIDLFDFLSSEDSICNPEEFKFDNKSDNAIELKDVKFRYPSSDRYALEGINLKIPYGENIAIVGKNGSGKSTLVKLLCRLYEPASGELIYGSSLDLSKGRYKNIATMFQDINTYCLSIAENISISEFDKYREDKIVEVIEKAFGKKWLHSYPEGINTKIGLAFGGVELSGGEKQKLSLSRTLFRTSTLLFFDEPTAAIDSLAEDKLYQDILKISKGKTTFFVTHRLATVRFADKIVVLDEGKIVEEGTFEELMRKDGMFASMYLLQKQGLA